MGHAPFVHNLHISLFNGSFLSEIRNIAVNRRSISSSVVARMKRSAVLLGSRRVRKGKGGKVDSKIDPDEEEEWDLEYDLMRPDAIVVIDDTNAYQHFGDVIFAAPQEDLLEGNLVHSKNTTHLNTSHRILP